MGLPTLTNLFNRLMAEHQERGGESDKENVHYALEFFYPHFKSNFPPFSYPPFEEFLSLIYAAEDFENAVFNEGYWREKRISSLSQDSPIINR